MIRKLRFRLIAASMLALLAVLGVIMGAVNYWNYRGICREADSVLDLLAVNQGRFPGRPMGQQPGRGDRPQMSPELPFESRFFSVLLTKDGQAETDLERIAAVDADTAVSMARSAAEKGSTRGFSGCYRYLIREDTGGTRVIFLDCTKNLDTFRRFLTASVGISLGGLAAVLVLLAALSPRIVRPVLESYEKQKQFITDAGHELKTPITIIDADAELLEMEQEGNEWLLDIRKQTRRLAALTNDLIYLSRMEEDRPALQAIDFPLSDVVAEAAHSFQALAKTRGQRFEIETAPMLCMKGDERAVRQLISILLDNAVKYTPEDGDIRLELKRQGKNAVLQVTNSAPGMDRKVLDQLFDRFYRADPARSTETGGHGLGLSIAKAIVLAHKGKISASMPEPDRLTITVTLPTVAL